MNAECDEKEDNLLFVNLPQLYGMCTKSIKVFEERGVLGTAGRKKFIKNNKKSDDHFINGSITYSLSKNKRLKNRDEDRFNKNLGHFLWLF